MIMATQFLGLRRISCILKPPHKKNNGYNKSMSDRHKKAAVISAAFDILLILRHVPLEIFFPMYEYAASCFILASRSASSWFSTES